MTDLLDEKAKLVMILVKELGYRRAIDAVAAGSGWGLEMCYLLPKMSCSGSVCR